MTQPEPGARFGRYHIVRLIGSGGMAAVYEARHVDLHKRVALKVLHRWLSLRLEVVQRFVLEARAASRFSHPHVVKILDIDSLDGVPFMAMDLLEGEQLAEVLDRDGPLPVPRLVDVVLPVLSAVRAAHDAGVLHRDIKPDNIFLSRGFHGEHPILLDFGISKVDSGGPAQPLTAAGELLGTPPYMSPEQVQNGMPSFDARSDQYALGVVLYECATGRLPFTDHPSVNALMVAIAEGGAPSVAALRPDVPPAFDAVVARAMSLDPGDRFPSVLELGRALLPLAGAEARAVWTKDFGAGGSSPVTPGPSARRATVTLTPSELRAIAVFAPVTDEEMARLPAVAPAARVAAGAALFDQGEAAASCFVVVSGEIDLFRTHGAETWKIDTVKAGATLGLPALWDDAPRPVSAIARTETVVLEIRRAELGRLCASLPELSRRLHETAATAVVDRRRRAETGVTELLDGPTAEVSREALVRLSAAIGEWSVPWPRRRR